MNDDDIQWFEEFWDGVPTDVDTGLSAIRLIGEMFRGRLIRRDGDELIGATERSGLATRLDLTADDQHLVRLIEEAARAATDEVTP